VRDGFCSEASSLSEGVLLFVGCFLGERERLGKGGHRRRGGGGGLLRQITKKNIL